MSSSQQAAALACRQWNLPSPQLIRQGMSTLYSAGDVVVRVVPGRQDSEGVLWLAQQLAARGVRVARHVRAPYATDAATVFGLERLTEVGQPDWCRVGEMVRRVHDWPVTDVVAHFALPSAAEFPWWQVETVLAEVDDLLDGGAREGLQTAIAQHGEWRERTTTRVVCHGDVHPGNVLQTADGPVLLDWDLFSLAPAAWDHAPMLTWEHRWGGEPGMYEQFASGYGADFRDDSLATSLAVMRNAAATLMRLRAGRTDPLAAAEAQRRLAYWRGDPTAPQWSAM